MEIRPVVASVVGKTSDTQWGQVLQLPNAYGIVEVAAPDGIARQRGITILSKLTDALSTEVVSLEALASIADTVMESDVVSLALLVPVGKVVYMVLRGEGSVFLRRGEKFATLMRTPGNISGEVKEGDCILAASRGFTGSLSPEEVGGVFDHLAPAEVAEKLTLILHEKHGGEGGAALIFEVAQMVSPEEVLPLAVKEPEEESAALRFGRRIVQLGRAFLQRITREKRLAITIALLFVFLVSVILGIQKQRGNVRAKQASSVIAEAQRAFDEGMALLDLNAVKGRERLSQAEQLLAPLVSSLSDRSAEGRRANELYKEVTENMSRAQHVVRATPALFYDASLIKKDAKVTAFAASEDRMGLLDTAGRTAYDLTLPAKSGQIAGGGEQYADASAIAVYGDRLYVLVPGGVHMIRLSDRKTVPNVAKKDDAWGAIRSIVAYGGNLYLLDTAKSRIWKYVATETGFSERREYLNPDTLPDLSKGTSMAIDGSVWIGTTDGRVLRFTQGKEQTYILQGLDSPLGTNILVDTEDGQKYLYILDPANKRVVVFDKDGLYMAQYLWEGDLAPTGFAISEEQKLIFLLSAGKIYATPLE